MFTSITVSERNEIMVDRRGAKAEIALEHLSKRLADVKSSMAVGDWRAAEAHAQVGHEWMAALLSELANARVR